MPTNAQAAQPLIRKSKAGKRSAISPAVALFAGWLIPGAGHLLLKKPIRAALLFVSIFAMFAIGIALEGKVYTPGTGDPLDILGFAADLGAGGLYILTRMLDLGHSSVQIAIADYGTKFIVVSGLLNIVAAVDAHSLASGRKPS
jgi:TM2 domain-containing membrane protein YozV